MIDFGQPLSAVGRNLRTMARQGQIDSVEAAKRVMFVDGSIDNALDLLLEHYERTPSRHLLEMIGDLYVNSGAQVAAKSVFKSIYYESSDLHVTNLIYAGLPATRALVDDTKKILYIPIPKCGSSSVKNYFTAAKFDKTYGETVHFQHPELYRTVTAADIDTTYADYFRFSLVRDPMKRLVSYFVRNVVGGSLRREARQQNAFLNMPTRPGPRQFAFNFHLYRQLFKDFRHHTDPICGYLDPFGAKLDKIYRMSDMGELREKISEVYGRSLEDDRAMVSKDDPVLKSECAEASKSLVQWYQRDYDGYF